MLGSTPPGGRPLPRPGPHPATQHSGSRRGRAATAFVPIGAPALSPEPVRTTGPYEAEALARAAARRIYRVARPPSRRARPVHAGRPTTCARSRRAAPVMRGLPTSAAVRSRVTAAGRRSIGAERVWCRRRVLARRWRRQCRRPDHRGPEGVGRPGRPLVARWRQQRTIVGMNRASRGSGAWPRRRLSLGWRLGKPGLACAQPVDDLCKGAANLCATWG